MSQVQLFNPEWVIRINIMGNWMRVKRGTFEEFTSNNESLVRFETLDKEYAIIADSSIIGWVYTVPEPTSEES